MAENQSSIISALHRLERAGSEHSASTAKLLKAAGALGAHVASLVPTAYYDQEDAFIQPELPRQYYASQQTVYTLDREYNPIYVEADRASALAFAADVADGWLEEVAQWLEARSAQDSVAVAVLERAAAGLRGEVTP